MDTKDLIIKSATKFYDELKRDKNGRYLSWEHCYSEFYNSRNKKLSVQDVDYLSLHLAFYLASWGMYRGSSFLLQQDYKVHIPVVEEIMKQKYDVLQGIKCSALKYSLDLLENLVKFMRTYYDTIRRSVAEKDLHNELSDTLITKILMGTLGCVPAYDRYFIAGIKKEKVSTGNFNNNSLLKLIKYYEDNAEYFESIVMAMNIGDIPYPQMKFLDMGFWEIGFRDNEDNVTIMPH